MKPQLALAILVALAAGRGFAQPPRVPVLVELYTSEGCSSCPPADALLESLARDQPVARAEIIPIGLHVDYFNDQGWKDAFSSASFTARQRHYSAVFGDDNMYTPQMVIDGETAIPGIEKDRIRRAIDEAAGKPHLPLRLSARAAGGKATLTIERPAAPPMAEKIQVFAAITEDGLSSIVTRGENGGRILHHVAVARALQTMDVLESGPMTDRRQFQLGKKWGPNLKAVVWLQGVKSREVYGAAVAPVVR
jgi:hypothetical protein